MRVLIQITLIAALTLGLAFRDGIAVKKYPCKNDPTLDCKYCGERCETVDGKLAIEACRRTQTECCGVGHPCRLKVIPIKLNKSSKAKSPFGRALSSGNGKAFSSGYKCYPGVYTNCHFCLKNCAKLGESEKTECNIYKKNGCCLNCYLPEDFNCYSKSCSYCTNQHPSPSKRIFCPPPFYRFCLFSQRDCCGETQYCNTDVSRKSFNCEHWDACEYCDRNCSDYHPNSEICRQSQRDCCGVDNHCGGANINNAKSPAELTCTRESCLHCQPYDNDVLYGDKCPDGDFCEFSEQECCEKEICRKEIQFGCKDPKACSYCTQDCTQDQDYNLNVYKCKKSQRECCKGGQVCSNLASLRNETLPTPKFTCDQTNCHFCQLPWFCSLISKKEDAELCQFTKDNCCVEMDCPAYKCTGNDNACNDFCFSACAEDERHKECKLFQINGCCQEFNCDPIKCQSEDCEFCHKDCNDKKYSPAERIKCNLAMKYDCCSQDVCTLPELSCNSSSCSYCKLTGKRDSKGLILVPGCDSIKTSEPSFNFCKSSQEHCCGETQFCKEQIDFVCDFNTSCEYCTSDCTNYTTNLERSKCLLSKGMCCRRGETCRPESNLPSFTCENEEKACDYCNVTGCSETYLDPIDIENCEISHVDCCKKGQHCNPDINCAAHGVCHYCTNKNCSFDNSDPIQIKRCHLTWDKCCNNESAGCNNASFASSFGRAFVGKASKMENTSLEATNSPQVPQVNCNDGDVCKDCGKVCEVQEKPALQTRCLQIQANCCVKGQTCNPAEKSANITKPGTKSQGGKLQGPGLAFGISLFILKLSLIPTLQF